VIIWACANSCAAMASSRSLRRFLSRSSTDGNFVFSNEVGVARGCVPIMSSKGDCCLSACFLSLCVNLRVGKVSFHVLGFEEQKMARYASIS